MNDVNLSALRLGKRRLLAVRAAYSVCAGLGFGHGSSFLYLLDTGPAQANCGAFLSLQRLVHRRQICLGPAPARPERGRSTHRRFSLIEGTASCMGYQTLALPEKLMQFPCRGRRSPSTLGRSGDRLLQCRARTCCVFGADTLGQHLYELVQLACRQAHVHAYAHVRLQLRLRAW